MTARPPRRMRAAAGAHERWLGQQLPAGESDVDGQLERTLPQVLGRHGVQRHIVQAVGQQSDPRPE
jgi:hypothetical protein